MGLKIRLARAGAKKRPYYHIVVADSRSPRDGRFIEKLGSYNPMLPADHAERIRLQDERITHWLSEGALPTDRVCPLPGPRRPGADARLCASSPCSPRRRRRRRSGPRPSRRRLMPGRALILLGVVGRPAWRAGAGARAQLHRQSRPTCTVYGALSDEERPQLDALAGAGDGVAEVRDDGGPPSKCPTARQAEKLVNTRLFVDREPLCPNPRTTSTTSPT